jgi:LSD1 subclass zinc finger protein
MDITGIKFSNDVQYDGSCESILFYAEIGSKKIKCALSQTAVNDYYQTDDSKEKALENYINNKNYFQDLAKDLIRNDRFTESGEIFISKYNLR